MKRFLISAALAASVSTAAIAATEAQVNQIERFAPGVDASSLSEVQVTQALAVINGSGSRSDRLGKLHALLGIEHGLHLAASPTAAQRAEIKRYAPDVDFSSMTQTQLEVLLLHITSGEGHSDIAGEVRSLTRNDFGPPDTSYIPAAAEVAILRPYIPEEVIYSLPEPTLKAAIAMVYGSDSRSDTMGHIRSFTGSYAPVSTRSTLSKY